MQAAVNAGSAKIMIKDMVSVLYPKRGMRLMAMPGARIRRIVTIILTAFAVVEIVRKISAIA